MKAEQTGRAQGLGIRKSLVLLGTPTDSFGWNTEYGCWGEGAGRRKPERK